MPMTQVPDLWGIAPACHYEKKKKVCGFSTALVHVTGVGVMLLEKTGVFVAAVHFLCNWYKVLNRE